MADKKQKVLVVHNYYQIPGGEDFVVENEKRMLEERGHAVMLYMRHNSELKELSKAQKLLLPFSTIFNYRTYREVRQLIDREKIDIMHVHNTLNLISPSVYYAAFSKKIPVVQTIHNFRLLCPEATFYRDGKICEDCLEQGLLCAVRHKCYRNSRIQTLACVVSTWIHRSLGTYGKLSYICLTEFNKEKLLNLKQIKREKVFVKPNFVFEKKIEAIKRKKTDRFVYVGRLEEIKGISVLLEAWKILGKEAPELILCGSGPLEQWCKDYVQSNGMENVCIRGYVPHEEVQEIIAESLALILPTQVYEGFPVTIVEAYAKGTSVIVSDLGNAGSLVIQDITGKKFSHKNAAELAETVKNFAPFDSAKIRDIYEKKYSEERNYRELLDIYEKISNGE